MGEVKPQPEQSLHDYLAWLEDTPSGQLPPGEDVSDLGMLGRTLYEHVSQDEVTRRVAVALQRGRSWHEISYYPGKTETAARAEYGPATGELASPWWRKETIRLIRAAQSAVNAALDALAAHLARNHTRLQSRRGLALKPGADGAPTYRLPAGQPRTVRGKKLHLFPNSALPIPYSVRQTEL
jgi:hypothetical protein